MANPNNCAACDHKRHPDGGWCYMFRDEPQAVCLKHSARRGMTVAKPPAPRGCPECAWGKALGCWRCGGR